MALGIGGLEFEEAEPLFPSRDQTVTDEGSPYAGGGQGKGGDKLGHFDTDPGAGTGFLENFQSSGSQVYVGVNEDKIEGRKILEVQGFRTF